MPDYGLFEASQMACPVLPQYHPKQLMELLNSGKIRWVKAILAHLVRWVVYNNNQFILISISLYLTLLLSLFLDVLVAHTLDVAHKETKTVCQDRYCNLFKFFVSFELNLTVFIKLLSLIFLSHIKLFRTDAIIISRVCNLAH